MPNIAQAGYFTIKNATPTKFIIGVPNKEVDDSITSLIPKILTGKTDVDLGVDDIRNDLKAGNIEAITDKLSRLFLNIDYGTMPIASEHIVRAISQAMLIGIGSMPTVEKHNALGRSDLEFDCRDWHYVFEFKYAKTEGEADRLLAEGIEQVKSRRYGEGDLSGRKLIRLVLVYCDETRSIARSARVD